MNFNKTLSTAILSAALLYSSAANADYTHYKIEQSGTSISFPSGMFNWEEELGENQTGTLFTAEDGGSLALFSYNNDGSITPKDIANNIRQNTSENFNITYERVTKNWMVQSGYQDDLVYYQRMEFNPSGKIHGMLLRYPKTVRKKYDRNISKIAKSLSGY